MPLAATASMCEPDTSGFPDHFAIGCTRIELGPFAGAFLAQAAAELEALCAESLEHASVDMPAAKPSARMGARHRSSATSAAPKTFMPQGRPVKTALQRAEELLARLTEDAGTWDVPGWTTGPSEPRSKQQISADQAGRQLVKAANL